MSISDFFMKYVCVGLYNRLQPQYPDGTKANFFHFVKYLEQQGREHVADSKCSIVVEDEYFAEEDIHPEFKWERAIENLKFAELVRNAANKKYVIPFEYEDEIAVLQKISPPNPTLPDVGHEERHIEEITSSDDPSQLTQGFEEDQGSDGSASSEDANIEFGKSLVEGVISALPALIGL